jgi:hypothetical protein
VHSRSGVDRRRPSIICHVCFGWISWAEDIAALTRRQSRPPAPALPILPTDRTPPTGWWVYCHSAGAGLSTDASSAELYQLAIQAAEARWNPIVSLVESAIALSEPVVGAVTMELTTRKATRSVVDYYSLWARREFRVIRGIRFAAAPMATP